MKARVFVTLKPGVLDPQGKAVEHGLQDLGYGEVTGVRVGKVFELELEADTDKARVERMCEQLLANTVIEDFRVELA